MKALKTLRGKDQVKGTPYIVVGAYSIRKLAGIIIA
jgi:hypothetical protein